MGYCRELYMGYFYVQGFALHGLQELQGEREGGRPPLKKGTPYVPKVPILQNPGTILGARFNYPQPSTLNPQPSTLNPKPQPLNPYPKPQTLNLKP